MKTFVQRCQDYHLAKSKYLTHADSLESHEIGNEQTKLKFQLYLDLTHWPDSPALRCLDQEQLAELVRWGTIFQTQLDAFHEKREALRSDMNTCLFDALKALGVEAAHAYSSMPGTVCDRLKAAFSLASSMRKTMLDGIGYVSDYDIEGSHFLPSFLRASKLSKKDFRQAILAAP